VKLNGILFIHIPRTGGTHFEKLLGFEGHNTPPRCGSARYGANREEIMGWDKDLKLMLTHATYEEMIEFNLLSLREELVRVSIVRNPYHRTVSLFKYFGGNKRWGNFESFLDALEKELSYRYFYLPQYEFLTHGNKVAIENLIKFEDYVADTEKFKTKYNLKFNVTFRTKSQIEKSKTSLETFYNNKSNLSKVEKIYQKDFELFGYDYYRSNP
jgi:hypothetical protein